MEETLIEFETAKLAKEKGFDYKTHYRYQGNTESDSFKTGGVLYNHNLKEEQELWSVKLYSAPTQSLLQKWLREEHKIEMLLEPYPDYYYVYVFKWGGKDKSIEGKTYEQALEAGLKAALKLITNKK